MAVAEEQWVVKQMIKIAKLQGFANTTVDPSPMQERIESVKSGIISGCATSLVWSVGSYVSRAWQGFGAIELLLTVGIAGISGFLFGVTYRYIIRHDRNPHLQSGAVGAFALVRGLSQAEPLLSSTSVQWGLILLLLGQNFLMFTIARWLLDQCYDRGWLSRFPSVVDEVLPESVLIETTDAFTETSVR